ncbi:DNA alkylation repair protein [Rufibacter quisquiliarum]|uniref:3-methyladenine DNA glycosylase AlkC n=1 Tax=Rufibacter quisquiliarum TaxID=1549639 RepID=A0A839GSD2_9BACT|nr:DNA alkylation repair protein [Rufibacter quisquiliarum]MBA9076731.1 3-methyladenine DNA glycosylase AlkC [Rufibacter quisquiliarum]
MATPLKEVYSPQFYEAFANVLQKILPALNKEEFKRQIFNDSWATKELKERMRHTAQVLHGFLPKQFPEAVRVILQTIEAIKAQRFPVRHVEFMFFPDYVELYGLEDPVTASKAMEEITQFISCEFAVRPFLLKYPQQMMAQMLAWTQHEHHAVRRFASEGCRPRLPWAMALPFLKKDPAPILPILENLKADASEFVRRSVANNLNDISKDNPALVLQLLAQWKGQTPETDWVVKHGCRTLLKQGHTEVLRYFGFEGGAQLALQDFKVLTPQVPLGNDLRFSFVLQNTSELPQKVRLEYGVYYQKANQSLARKVFKISEREYAPAEQVAVTRKQSFKFITTRKYYPGPHRVSLIVNGQEKEMADFTVVR